MVPYLRMLVVGDIRARSYATGQQSLGDETTDGTRDLSLAVTLAIGIGKGTSSMMRNGFQQPISPKNNKNIYRAK